MVVLFWTGLKSEYQFIQESLARLVLPFHHSIICFRDEQFLEEELNFLTDISVENSWKSWHFPLIPLSHGNAQDREIIQPSSRPKWMLYARRRRRRRNIFLFKTRISYDSQERDTFRSKAHLILTQQAGICTSTIIALAAHSARWNNNPQKCASQRCIVCRAKLLLLQPTKIDTHPRWNFVPLPGPAFCSAYFVLSPPRLSVRQL